MYKYLITYLFIRNGKSDGFHAMQIVDDPIEWLNGAQQHDDGTYFLINSQRITRKQARKYDGAFRGM